MKKIFFMLILLSCTVISAQNTPKELKFNFTEKGDYFIKMTFLNQTWLRYNNNNPGSTLFDVQKDKIFDIGLRRTRLQLFGQLSKHVFFYTQLGQNNFTFNSARKQGFFIHDALGEVRVYDKHLSVGAGLTGWSGLARFASPGVGSILMLDAPLYEQATNDITDQFLRKLSIYAKGKLGKLDYRFVVSKPMADQLASASGGNFGPTASFSKLPSKLQYNGYINYQFLDEESNLLPYTTGTYLGKKRIFNIGAGFVHQKDAIWRSDNNGDTLLSALNLVSIDAFLDLPLDKEKQNALTAYTAFQYSDYGKNYIRNLGPMNPMTGTTTTGASINGAGNAWPTMGTGFTFFGQIGYKFKNDLFKNDWGTLQPYAGVQAFKYDYFNQAAATFDVGLNWLIDGHRSKLTLNYENRPVFNSLSDGTRRVTDRKGTVVLQYQIFL